MIRSVDPPSRLRLRSIYDNELPSEVAGFDNAMLSVVEEADSFARSTTVSPSAAASSGADNDELNEWNMIPFPAGTERRKQRGKGRKGKKRNQHKKKMRELPEEVQYWKQVSRLIFFSFLSDWYAESWF